MPVARHGLTNAASADSLAALANYRQFTHALDWELARSMRDSSRFTVLLLEIAAPGDAYHPGAHLAALRTLRRVADALCTECRPAETAARIGSGEFAVIIPDAGAEVALELAERIDIRLCSSGPALVMTAAVAVFPLDGATPGTLLGAAYARLDELKAAGN